MKRTTATDTMIIGKQTVQSPRGMVHVTKTGQCHHRRSKSVAIHRCPICNRWSIRCLNPNGTCVKARQQLRTTLMRLVTSMALSAVAVMTTACLQSSRRHRCPSWSMPTRQERPRRYIRQVRARNRPMKTMGTATVSLPRHRLRRCCRPSPSPPHPRGRSHLLPHHRRNYPPHRRQPKQPRPHHRHRHRHRHRIIGHRRIHRRRRSLRRRPRPVATHCR